MWISVLFELYEKPEYQWQYIKSMYELLHKLNKMNITKFIV